MRIVAIVAAFNEADVIACVVGDLIAQGVQVYVLDDGSTDGTSAAVEPFLDRGVIAIDRLAPAGGGFDWERILRRKTELARELDADWFIHHDADEFRESPWPHLTLAEAIKRVDALGYNAIDFASLNFWPIHDDFQPGSDVRQAYPYYSEQAPYDRVQIRCWKKTPDVDLASSGGHEAQFEGRRVFPLRFILRHYPIRGQAHGERKIFAERRARFRAEERARGWHVQYDEIAELPSFIRDPGTLTPYDPDAVRVALTLRHRGVEDLEQALAAAQSDAVQQQKRLDEIAEDRDRHALALARTHDDLRAKNVEIGTLHGELDKRLHELGAAHADVEARGLEIRRWAAEYVELRSEIDKRLGELVAAHADVEARGFEIRRWADEAAALRSEIGKRLDELAAAHADVGARGLELEARRAEIARLGGALADSAAEISRWRASLDDALRRLGAIEDSVSWRLTAPLRRLMRLLRGR